ncbi:MAG: hypothetical protein MK207_11930 [Saprospiraceae bacterium]|nr:hypothetical protein [Saprospiraceae bacterium]
MRHLIGLLIIFLFSISINAQKKGKTIEEVKNRRSSLHTMLVQTGNKFLKKELVIAAYDKAPFPDKYNNHYVGTAEEKAFNPFDYTVTNEDRLAVGIKVAAEDDTTSGENKKVKDLPALIAKHLKEKSVAKQLVAKWFNRQPDGSFNINLISERGFYNATDLDASLAAKTVRGRASLADAGEELIKNTFVVVNKMFFLKNEPFAKATQIAAIAAAQKLPIGSAAAIQAANLAYEKAKDGYSVWTTSFLYQLAWNDSIQSVFYNDLYGVKNKDAFDKTDLFTMKYIGKTKATSLVLFGKGTEQETIELAVIRNIDNVYARLQKNYEVFKTKTPLFTSDPITAKIGKKEGLEGGEKFEVLEQGLDSKTGLTYYKRKGVITVEEVHDNRYNAGEEDENGENNVTTFKGGKKFYPGMLIRQMK